MKKYLSLLIALLMILSVFSGCSENGKAYLDIYKEISEWETIESSQEFNVKVNLKEVADASKAQVKEITGEDMKVDEEDKKMLDLIEKYSDFEIKAKVKSYADSGDYINTELKMNTDIEIKFLGDTYTAKNIEIIMKDQKYYISNSYFDFIVDSTKKIANKVADEIGVSDSERAEIDEIDEMFDEIVDKDKEYVVFSFGEYGNVKDELTKIGMSVEDFKNTQINIKNLIFDLFKKLNVEMRVSNQGSKYTYELSLYELIDKTPTVIKEFKLHEKDFVKKIIAEMAKFQPELISEEDLAKFDKEYKSVFEEIPVEIAIPMIENYLDNFGNSYVKNTAELKDGVFSEDSEMEVMFNDKNLINITAKQTSKKVSRKNIVVPADEKCNILENNVDNMAMTAQVSQGVDAINSNPFMQFGNFVKTYSIMQNAKNNVDVSKAMEQVEGIYQERILSIDGKEYKLDAFNINGNTYYKLRDVSAALSETNKKFAVSWDPENKSITINTGEAHKGGVSGISRNEEKINEIGVANSPNIKIDGDEVYFMEIYNFGGSNYFQIRELGIEFDFQVKYDEETKLISIDTTKSYYDDFEE